MNAPDLDPVMIATVCHEANRMYCAALGDFSQKQWANVPQWQRDSAINGVIYAIAHPGVTPEMSHDNWLKEKESDGWTYGLIKDETKKEHPCLVAYDNLPNHQKRKDHLFLAIVKALA